MKMAFDFDISKFRSQLGEAVQKKAERITQQIVNGVIARSPVDSGAFRQSWNVSEGRPIYIQVGRGRGNGSPLPAPRITVTATTQFPVFYITNGQPYAEELENGSSGQAPAGMVRVTLASIR